jgi:hypothetical protein
METLSENDVSPCYYSRGILRREFPGKGKTILPMYLSAFPQKNSYWN